MLCRRGRKVRRGRQVLRARKDRRGRRGQWVRMASRVNRGRPATMASPGAEGPPGPPFANAVVEVVNTLGPGEPATVEVEFLSGDVRFTFGIPQGTRGSDGTEGSSGPPGEVSAEQLSDAITSALTSAAADSSANTNAVATLESPFADPDLESVRGKINELISALRR